MRCCDERIEGEVLTGRDKDGSVYYETQWVCPHCLRVEYSERELVPGTAERGNKDQRTKDKVAFR